jgi:hypothetical protein
MDYNIIPTNPDPYMPSLDEAREDIARIIRDFLSPGTWEVRESDYLLAVRIMPVIEAVRAEAWDEGRIGGIEDVDTSGYGDIASRPNPYRKGDSHGE